MNRGMKSLTDDIALSWYFCIMKGDEIEIVTTSYRRVTIKFYRLDLVTEDTFSENNIVDFFWFSFYYYFFLNIVEVDRHTCQDRYTMSRQVCNEWLFFSFIPIVRTDYEIFR